MIKLYRRTNDLTQIKHETPTNRRVIEHKFSNLTRSQLFEEAEKILEESGYTPKTGWKRDVNFDIWYINVSEEILP